MSLCYVLSDAFKEDLVKNTDPGEAREIIAVLKSRKQTADSAEAILERKTYHGTKRVQQIKIGQWRIAALYIRGIDIAEVIQLCYLYNKNQNREPNRDILTKIDETAERLFAEVADWRADEQSEYLAAMRTDFPNL